MVNQIMAVVAMVACGSHGTVIMMGKMVQIWLGIFQTEVMRGCFGIIWGMEEWLLMVGGNGGESSYRPRYRPRQ